MKRKNGKIIISVIDDGTTTEETRRGAIGDILYTIQQKNIDDEVVIIAGDNFFTYSLKDYFNYYKKLGKDCICVKEFNDLELLKQMGVAQLDENNKVISIDEKKNIIGTIIDFLSAFAGLTANVIAAISETLQIIDPIAFPYDIAPFPISAA